MPGQTQASFVYQTITGGRISLSGLSDAEYDFLELIAKKYNAKQDWTRFAAWWNSKFNASGLATTSVVYRICQDLEARLGINQGKVALPDYRDSLAELIDAHFGSRQDFCRATGVDSGQLSRVLASRDNLSIKVLLQVLEVLHARLVIRTHEDACATTSLDAPVNALNTALARRSQVANSQHEMPPMRAFSTGNEIEAGEGVPPAWESYFPNVPYLDQVYTRANAAAKQHMPLMVASPV